MWWQQERQYTELCTALTVLSTVGGEKRRPQRGKDPLKACFFLIVTKIFLPFSQVMHKLWITFLF